MRLPSMPYSGIPSLKNSPIAPTTMRIWNAANVLSRPTFVHGLATVQANTPRQMPSSPRQRRTPVSHDTANLTIRV